MARTTDPTLGIYADIVVQIDPDRNIGGPYFIVEGYFSVYDPKRLDRDNNPEYVYGERAKGLLIRSLMFRGQCSRESVERAFADHTEPTIYGHCLEFSHGGDIEEMKEKVQTLGKIQRKLDAMYEAEGYGKTIGQQIARYLRAMGIQLVRFHAPQRERRIITRTADVVDLLDTTFRNWHRSITASALEAEAAA